MAKRIAELLKEWIESGSFYLTEAVEKVPLEGSAAPMLQRAPKIVKTFNRERFELHEGQNIYREDQTCIHCGLCLSLCPEGVFGHDASWNIIVDHRKCNACRICADVCPVDAIHIREEKGER